MINHRRMVKAGNRKFVKASRRTWTHLVPASTVQMLKVPVVHTELKLEIGKITITLAHEERPVIPDAFKDNRPSRTPNPVQDLWMTDGERGRRYHD